jgi:hypothetical protein
MDWATGSRPRGLRNAGRIVSYPANPLPDTDSDPDLVEAVIPGQIDWVVAGELRVLRCRLGSFLRSPGRCCNVYPSLLHGGSMERSKWLKPVVISKPVSETAQGAGSNADGIGGEFPIPPTS